MHKRILKVFLELCGVMVAGLAVLLVLAAVRLSFGPVAMDFLTPHIERGFTPDDGSYRVAVHRTVLTWGGWNRTLDVQLSGVRVTNAQGGEQIFIPDLAVGFSLRALMSGRIAPARVELFRPRLTVVRHEDGTFAMGEAVSGAAGTGTKAPAPKTVGSDITGTLLAQMIGPPTYKGPLGYLRLVSMLEADLAFDDRFDGLLLRAPGSQVVLSRDAGGLGLDARININDGTRRAQLRMVGGYNADEKSLDIETRLANLVPADFAGLSPVLQPLSMARLPISGKVLTRIGLDGKLGTVAVDLEAGEGRIEAPAYFAAPVEVRAAALKAQADTSTTDLVIEAFTADLGGPRIALSGKTARADGRVTLALEAGARDVAATDLKRLWPEGVAPGGREWVLENVVGGGVEQARVQASISAQEGEKGALTGIRLEKLDGGFDYKGLTVHYLRPLPPVTAIDGTAKVSVSELDFTVTGGRLGKLRVGDGRFRLYDLDTDIERMALELVAGGPIGEVVGILNHPRLDLVKGLGLEPGKIAGSGATRLVMKFPLRRDLKFDHIEIAAASRLRDVVLPGAALGNDLTDGTLTLQLDKRGMDVSGKAKLGGVLAELKWTENFYAGALFSSRYSVKGVADDAARKRFGLGFLDSYVTGPVGADLIITKHDKRQMTLTGALDLKSAGLSFEELAWRKLPGVAGFARLRLSVDDDVPQAIEQLSIRAGDLTASGSIHLDPGGKSISHFRIDELRYADNAFGVTGRYRADGGLAMDIKGARVDIRPFMRQGDDGKPKTPLDITVALDQVRAAPNAVIAGVRGRLVRDSVDWNIVDITGSVGNGAPLTVWVGIDGGAQRLRIRCVDAGAALAAFDITDKVVGGTLNIQGNYDLSKETRPLTGHFAMRKFHMQRAPFLAKLLSALSLTGILDALSGNGIAFDRADVPFVKAGQTLILRDSRAHGGAVGITAEGTLDLEKDTLDLKGTLVPAYTLNSFFADIPLIGSLLVPEKGSGLFAATYSMNGPIEDPRVVVNPLATLTPGFLRGLFNIFDAPEKKPPAADRGAAPSAPEKPVVTTPSGPVGPVTPMPEKAPEGPMPESRR